MPGGACQAYCAHLTTIAACPADLAACLASECEAGYDLAPWCAAEVDAVYLCGAQEPESSFECSASGKPKLMSGFCAAEKATQTACFYEGPAGGLPDMTADCQAHCSSAAGLPCDSPTCLQDCLDLMADAEPCNGAQAMLIHCFAQQPAANYQCGPTQNPYPSGSACVAQVFALDACMP